jgi:hypothetical protein
MDLARQEPTFDLFTSLRYDPILIESQENARVDGSGEDWSPFYMLSYHRDRILAAATHFEWDAVIQKLEHEAGLKLLKGEMTLAVAKYFGENGDQNETMTGTTKIWHKTRSPLKVCFFQPQPSYLESRIRPL